MDALLVVNADFVLVEQHHVDVLNQDEVYQKVLALDVDSRVLTQTTFTPKLDARP
jgi:hypothetical protein